MDFQDERLRGVQESVRELLPPRKVLVDAPTLDVSKPNFHDSKAEFRRELKSVEAAIEALRKVLRAIYPADQNTDEQSAQLARRLAAVVDQGALPRVRVAAPLSIRDLIRKNKADTGDFKHALWGLIDLLEVLEDRRDELKNQEGQYWNKKHRPPNY